MASNLKSLSTRAALNFVILIGIVSLFADMTYEGARSVTGPYLAILGASGAVVGLVAGLGELIGYGLRLVSGYLSDRTGRYWAITIVGYVVNMAAVPLLALAGRWELAALLTLAPGACAPAQVQVSLPSGRARPSVPPPAMRCSPMPLNKPGAAGALAFMKPWIKSALF